MFGIESTVLVKQLVLIVHTFAFAFAVAAVLREDVLCLMERQLDLVRLHSTARLTGYLLLALWATGIALLVIEYGLYFHWSVLSAKLLCKIAVVVSLTANGLILHWIVFPRLETGSTESAPWACIFGAVSTVSWVYAACVGLGRYVGVFISLEQFMLIYAVLLAVGVFISLVFVAPRLYKQMAWAEWAEYEAATH
jgi:hypothetical protein